MSFLIDASFPETHRAEGFFCASNTGSGFKNYFPDVFSGLSRLYIIKGGPGTGKSTLMKKIAAEAENRSYETELFFCSSDTDSLDGVIVYAPGGAFGVVDGTSPHVWEPKCPGACQQSLDLSRFWNEKYLESKSLAIRALNAEICARYRRVYLDLAAVFRARTLMREYVRPWVLFDKMDAWIGRFVSRVRAKGEERLRIRRAFGVHGGVCLDEFANAGKKILVCARHPALTGLLLERLQDALIGEGCAFDVSYAPVTSETDGIRLRDPDVALIPYSGEDTSGVSDGGNVKILNAERFLDPRIKNEKQRLKTLLSACADLTNVAAHELSEIGKLHDLLEEYYIGAMDHEKLDLFTKKLLIRLFCRQDP